MDKENINNAAKSINAMQLGMMIFFFYDCIHQYLNDQLSTMKFVVLMLLIINGIIIYGYGTLYGLKDKNDKLL